LKAQKRFERTPLRSINKTTCISSLTLAKKKSEIKNREFKELLKINTRSWMVVREKNRNSESEIEFEMRNED
jgi:hypothetical protein